MRLPLRRFAKTVFVSPRRPNRVGQGLANGMELVLPPVVFTLLGYWLDGKAGTRPLLTITLFLLASIGTLLSSFYKYRARSEAHDEGQPWARPRVQPGVGKSKPA